ncbi:MAG: hypothetical protein KAX20_02865 [Candidatus Omnitrophica bacterium]|nr:hypothetical protein [Candidatus Omnitrophota bacterium]
MSADNFVAITGDLVSSRQIKERERIQRELDKINRKVNRKFKEVLVVPFSFRGGDEIQGLLKEFFYSIEIVYLYTKNLYPQRIRFGIGKGTISTAIAETTIQMDGKSFTRSREALESAKKENKYIVYSTGSPKIDSSINTIFLLIQSLQRDWKPLHYRRFWLYKELKSIEKVAKEEDISKQAIAKSLKIAHCEVLLKAERVLKSLLSEGTSSLSTPQG